MFSRMPITAILLALIGVFTAATGTCAQIPSTVYVFDVHGKPSSQLELMDSVAGIVNRTSGEVFLSENYNPLWLAQLKGAYPQAQSQVIDDPAWYIDHYRSSFNGYVLYDRSTSPDSLNHAASIAGVTNSIMVDPSTLSYATNAGLTLTADTRSMTYSQVYSQYGSQFNKKMLFHQPLSDNYHVRDYSVMNKGFVFYQPSNMGAYLAQQDPNGRVYGGYDNEYSFFSTCSQNSQMAVPANYCVSSSTTSAWDVPLSKQQTHTSPSVTAEPGKHYVSFVMSDGDNLQYMTNLFYAHNWASSHRGEFNMTWDMSPTLAEMNPVAMNYFYANASTGANRDFFINSGGLGLAFPSQYPDIDGFKSATVEGMKNADQNIISVLDNSYDLNKLSVLLDDPQVMALMYKTYGQYYKGRDGAIDWINGKPILSVKYSLWDGSDTADSIANAINNSSHYDPLNDQASYDIVNVHPWSSDPMGNLKYLVDHLNSNVEVVPLDELMILLRANFGTPVPVPEPSTFILLTVGVIGGLTYGRLVRLHCSQ